MNAHAHTQTHAHTHTFWGDNETWSTFFQSNISPTLSHYIQVVALHWSIRFRYLSANHAPHMSDKKDRLVLHKLLTVLQWLDAGRSPPRCTKIIWAVTTWNCQQWRPTSAEVRGRCQALRYNGIQRPTLFQHKLVPGVCLWAAGYHKLIMKSETGFGLLAHCCMWTSGHGGVGSGSEENAWSHTSCSATMDRSDKWRKADVL